MNVPSREKCLDTLKDNGTPSNVIGHCKVVCKVAEEIAENLIKKGTKVNRDLVVAGALLHDIERHKDNHVIRGAELVKKLGYPEVSEVIRYHAYHEIQKDNNFDLTPEQKIVFYADKRARNDKIVSVDERYEDLEKRYNVELSDELGFVKKIEKELMDND